MNEICIGRAVICNGNPFIIGDVVSFYNFAFKDRPAHTGRIVDITPDKITLDCSAEYASKITAIFVSQFDLEWDRFVYAYQTTEDAT